MTGLATTPHRERPLLPADVQSTGLVGGLLGAGAYRWPAEAIWTASPGIGAE